MTLQSGLGPRTINNGAAYDPADLRVGQVAAPYAPGSSDFDAYVDRCLRTWSVDVVLDQGEYLTACKIVVPQGNLREGLRRMFTFPRARYDERHWVGDTVIVAFLRGDTKFPIVLGAVYPDPIDPDPTRTLAGPNGVESDVFITPSPNEWRDRHEVVDYTEEANPLVRYTERRDAASTVSTEHVVFTNHPDAPDDPARNVEAHVLTLDEDAATLRREHLVQRHEDNVVVADYVLTEDVDARDLTRVHHRQETPDLAHHVLVQDLAAKVLRLEQVVQQQAGLLNTLLLHSEDADRVTLHHRTGDATTPDHTFTLVSDGERQHVGFVKTTPDGSASISFESDNTVVVRCAPDGQPDSRLVMEEDGTINLQSGLGSSLRLSDGVASLRSGSATVVIRDDHVSLATDDGGFVSLTGESAVVASKQVTLDAPQLALHTGAARVGTTPGGTYHLLGAERVYPKLAQLEHRVRALETHAKTHVHKNTKPGSPSERSGPPQTGPTPGPEDSFATARIPDDSLKTLKGD